MGELTFLMILYGVSYFSGIEIIYLKRTAARLNLHSLVQTVIITGFAQVLEILESPGILL